MARHAAQRPMDGLPTSGRRSGRRHAFEAPPAERPISNLADLLAHDEAIDRAVCGRSLADERASRYADQGAHDAAPTFYFVLEELFGHVELSVESHLLDVGCSTGRVLAHFLRAGLPGRTTGVELDPELAAKAQAWTSQHGRVDVICGSALDLDLDAYTDLYLFNPFSPPVLQRFIEAIEAQLTHPITLIHMSDNGDTWHYVGRPGWTELASGTIQDYRNSRGYPVRAFTDPQHYTIWHYEGHL